MQKESQTCAVPVEDMGNLVRPALKSSSVAADVLSLSLVEHSTPWLTWGEGVSIKVFVGVLLTKGLSFPSTGISGCV